MPDPTRPPGMTDVARLAGVSHQTVSRVLNDPDVVRPATRDRVLAAIAQLGYRRNMPARALATRQSRLLGVIVAEGGYHGPSSTSSAIQTAAREHGFGTLVASIRNTTDTEVSQVVDLLLLHAVEGIAVIAPEPPLIERLKEARGIPTVLIADGVTPPAGMHVVAVDQYRGACLATEHLLATGRRDIAHVRGPQSWFDARERERGWADTLAGADVAPGRLVAGDWSAASGHAAGEQLASSPPDAVFASNDLMAVGLLSAFGERGIRVPEDVAVVGFDDIAGAAYLTPPLTTVRQPFAELGAASVDALLEAIAGRDVRPRHIEPALVVRRSSG